MLKPVLMLKTYSFWLMVFLSSATSLIAQDPAFSQFYAAKAYLNPALTAYEQGVTINTSYRRQWSGVPNSYQTLLLSSEWREKKLGIGLLASQDTEGVGQLTTTEVSCVGSYTQPLSDELALIGGVLFSPFLQRALNTSDLVFSDQLDPLLGVVSPIKHPFDNPKVHSMDLGLGLALRGVIGTIFKKEVKFLIGGAAHRMRQPPESVLHSSLPKTPMRLTGHLGLEIPVIGYGKNGREKWLYWMPTIRFEGQKQMNLVSLGSFLIFEDDLFCGIFYQNNIRDDINKNTDAFVLQFGFKKALAKDRTFQISVGYEANRSGLGGTSGGVYEVHTSFNFGDTHFSKTRKSGGMPSNSRCYLF